jgi:hypothetical protein
MENTDLENKFTYHAPEPDRAELHAKVREYFLLTAEKLDKFLPESWEKSQAIVKLEESMFWSNAAIARNS